WDNLSGYHGFLAPDLSPFPASGELVKDTQLVRDGLGTLLMQLRMEDDGIAVLYSMPSTYISHFDGNPTFGDYKRDHDVWRTMLHGAGLQFRYVTDRMLRRGEFDLSHYKVLLLPLAYAVGPGEAGRIREFVRNGGTVIADLRPGLYDDHLKRLDPGALDDVFGIRRSGHRDAVGIDRMSAGGELGGVKARIEWGNWHGRDVYPRAKVDTSVEVTTGKPLGQAFRIHYWTGLNTPVAVVNDFGKGRAILLNWSVFEVPSGDFIESLLRMSGVTPAIRIAREDGGPVSGIKITRWTNGQSALAALLGDYNGPVKVALPAPRRIHDLRQHKYLGKTATFTTALRADRATFLALEAAPAEEAAPEVRFPMGAARRGEVVRATVNLAGTPAVHPVRLRVFTPNGRPAGWFDRTALVGRQPAEWILPLAYNDPVGDWTVRAVDLLTDRSVTARLRVR
ncbi:MAG: beta-galactosidase trimerization domain-containing protein, partial [Bryobacterales bacterium]|nr:beta-galactosidase trimerization domain-containing protein [Bryobacterales bacterium]